MGISTVTAVPKMTSNTAPSGIANASTNHSSSQSFIAFDQNYALTSSAWTTNAIPTGWISYQFTRQLFIGKYAIYPQQTALTRAPKNWTFEGSNDGATWTILDTQSNVTTWANSTRKEFIVSTPKLFNTYRLNITANNGDSQYLSIGEFEMFELTYSNKFLISSEDKYYSLIYDPIDLIPKMTSDILPSGIATCSSMLNTSGAYNAFNAFDKNIIQSGSFNSWVTASGQLIGWLAYEFLDAVVVNKYTLVHGYNNVNVAPKSWTFEGTDDNGLTWTVLDQRDNVTDWILWTEKEFEFTNLKKFKKYRINITANNGNTSNVGIQELKMYDTNRTLLSCPSSSEGIFVKSGININEVIGTHKEISKKSYLTTSSTQIGSGKVFKQKIDTSKTPIKKASIT
ncbi:discoidin domain-containing protein [Paenibacillus sp. FSL L8-0435]|uniref:discoidin domain-containing protein n=1 Tax=Paenibacillus sp. FSL L8-0435 TaxID=2954618 RepID=UPI0030D9278F